MMSSELTGGSSVIRLVSQPQAYICQDYCDSAELQTDKLRVESTAARTVIKTKKLAIQAYSFCTRHNHATTTSMLVREERGQQVDNLSHLLESQPDWLIMIPMITCMTDAQHACFEVVTLLITAHHRYTKLP